MANGTKMFVPSRPARSRKSKKSRKSWLYLVPLGCPRKNILKSQQSEQGFRYLNKFNSNILLKISKKIKIKPEFYWFNKNEIKELIKIKNIINMDTISVLSSFILKVKKNYQVNSLKKIYNWIFGKFWNFAWIHRFTRSCKKD